MSTPTVHRYANTEFMNLGYGDEFIVVIDSLGRKWNPLLHPRDKNGRFIRTFSFVTFEMPDGSTVSGRVAGIDRDGNLLVKVQGITDGADPRLDENGYVKVPHDKVEVRTIKAQLGGKATGQLTGAQNVSVTNAIANMRELGLTRQADKMEVAQKLAMEDIADPDSPASAERKQDAIDLMREVGEDLGDERGKGFKQGDDAAEVEANLPTDEAARLRTIDDAIKATFTARHSLGDKTVEDIETSQGQMKGNMPEVRESAAQNELIKAYNEGTKVWDITSGELVEGEMERPVKATVRDTAADPQEEGLPELGRSSNKRQAGSRDRLVGSKQAAQVAPGDRHHVDKNGDEVRVGHILEVDATKKGRPALTGMVVRLYTDASQKKFIYVRDFDPNMEKGYTKTVRNKDGTTTKVPATYQDHQVSAESVEMASEDQQSTLFARLTLESQDKTRVSLARAFTEEYMAAMQRRFATPGAGRISGTQGLFDLVPIHLRQKEDKNGQMIGIGDAVQGPLGEDGYVSYMEPNSANTKVHWRNGKSAVLTSKKLTRWHGPSSDVYPGQSDLNTNNYVPTRDEAAEIAETKGATSVAEVIRSDGDAHAIQAAMTTDVAFQGELDDLDARYDKRDQTQVAGQGLSAEEQADLNEWDRLFVASTGTFREPDAPPPTPPTAPEPDPAMEGDAPQNPDNPSERITPEGVTVREEDGNVIVNDNTENPIPVGDQAAIDQAVEEAAGQPEPEADAEAPAQEGAPQGLAQKLASDVKGLAEEAKKAPNVDNNQRAQIDQFTGRLVDAVAQQDGDAVVRALQGMTTMVNRQVNANLKGTRLAQMMNGKFSNGTPMAKFIQDKLAKGEDIFGAGGPVSRADRPEGAPDESPEGVDPVADSGNAAVSEAVLADDGSAVVMVGDQQVTDGFYVMDHATISEYDSSPTVQDVTDFLNESKGSSFDGVTIWHDETDGKYRMARVGVFEDEQEAADAAKAAGTNQFVNIADGAVMNVAIDGDQNAPAEAVEDARSEERTVRTAGAGKASAPTTAKQKSLLDHVAEASGDEEIARITEAVKNGEEISGADASRLADLVDGLDAGQFEKPQDKGLASQLAHKLARAAGEEGARGYSSQNTALGKTSNVGIGLTAQSEDDNIRSLVTAATADVKNGDMQAAAEKFREAADAFDALGKGNPKTSVRAREHADRLDAMGGTTGPAPEGGAPEAEAPAPEAPEAEAPAPEETAPVETPEAEAPGGGEEGPPPPETPEAPATSPDDEQPPVGTLEVGQRVTTEYGDGEVVASTGRSVTVKLDNGEQINVQTGTPGYDRITPIGDAPAEGGGEGSGSAPDVAEIQSVLSTVDDAIDNERQSEGDNGPIGWTEDLDEANAQLGLIRGKVTSEGPYTQLSEDLRDLATFIEDHWRMSDPSGSVEELRRIADELDAGGETDAEVPAGAPEPAPAPA